MKFYPYKKGAMEKVLGILTGGAKKFEVVIFFIHKDFFR